MLDPRQGPAGKVRARQWDDGHRSPVGRARAVATAASASRPHSIVSDPHQQTMRITKAFLDVLNREAAEAELNVAIEMAAISDLLVAIWSWRLCPQCRRRMMELFIESLPDIVEAADAIDLKTSEFTCH
jgi:hypothetical protein